MTGLAFAETETPLLDQRQTNQEQRIDQGITREQLNERESNRLYAAATCQHDGRQGKVR